VKYIFIGKQKVFLFPKLRKIKRKLLLVLLGRYNKTTRMNGLRLRALVGKI
jgi:hypothetical protein